MEKKDVKSSIVIAVERTMEEKVDHLIIQFSLLKVTLESKIKELQKQINKLKK